MSSSPPTAPVKPRLHATHDRPFFALSQRLIAMILITMMFAAAKLAAERGVHLVEILFYRQLFSVPVVAIAALTGPGLASLRTGRAGLHFTRSMAGLCGMFFNFLAYILLPLAEATTIGFSMPIFGTIFSALLLGERTGIHRWSAVVIGFIGVIIIAQPEAHHAIAPVGLAVAVAAAVSSALISILLRQIGRTEAPLTTVFWFSVMTVPPLALLMPFYAAQHDLWSWALLIGAGLTGGLAQIGMTTALRWAPVSLVLPMDYSAILWSTLLGWLLWSSWPSTNTFIGGAIIIASGLYIAYREHKRIQQVQDISAAP